MLLRMNQHVRRALAVIAVAAAGLAAARGQQSPASSAVYTSWRSPGGGLDSPQYSALKQINKTNVAKLELQWFLPAPGPSGRFAFSPLVVDDVMYVVGAEGAVFAVNAETGKEVWRHQTEAQPT